MQALLLGVMESVCLPCVAPGPGVALCFGQLPVVATPCHPVLLGSPLHRSRGVTVPLNTLMQSRQLNPNFHMLVTRHLHWLNLTNLVITIRREQSLQALQLFQHGKPLASL